jgi:hypothetical protein
MAILINGVAKRETSGRHKIIIENEDSNGFHGYRAFFEDEGEHEELACLGGSPDEAIGCLIRERLNTIDQIVILGIEHSSNYR